MESTPSGYVLVSAVKNESSMLEGLFESVVSQTLRPMLWVVADDGSDDDTLAKANALSESHPWILVTSRKGVECHSWLKYASAVRFAIEVSAKEISLRGLNPAVIGVLDGDTTVNRDYYERLVHLAMAPKTGIVSGLITTEGGGGLESRPMARGCARIYSMDFLEVVGGFPFEPSPDTVLEIKARNRGYAFRVRPDAEGLHRRKSTSIAGSQSLRPLGVIRYVMGMDSLSALAWSMVYSRAVGVKAAMSFVSGYLEGARRGYPMTCDSEVIQHFRRSWLRLLSTPETREAVHSIIDRS